MVDSEIEFPSFPPTESYVSSYLYNKWHLG